MTFEINLSFDLPNIFDFALIIISVIIGFSLLILLLLLKKSKFPIWVTRKTVHFLGGTFIAFLAPLFHSFLSIIIAISIFLLFFVILIFSSNFKILEEYFVLKECRENEKKFTFVLNTASTLIFLILIYIIFNNYLLIFTTSALVISWADTFGEIIGRTLPFIRYKIFSKKTISGSLGVCVFSILSFLISFLVYREDVFLLDNWIWKIFLSSIIITLIEAFSWRWLDNIFLPLITSTMMFWIYFY